MKKILALLLCVATVQVASAQWQRTPTPNDTLQSVVANADGSVTFSIYAPNAQSVGLTGDIMAFGPNFEKAENGVWSVTLPNVATGAYRYAFTVDGIQVFDPKYQRLAEMRPVAKIDKGEAPFWAQKDVPHGAVSEIYYKSTTTGTTRRMHVWTPAGKAAKKKLPVFYLIHGGGDNDASWPGVGCAGDILDNLLAEGKIKPMLVVMPDGSMDTDAFVGELTNDIMPYIKETFKIKKGAKNTALAGLSMGGLETLNCFIAHPDMFGYINVMSSGWFENNPEQNETGAKKLLEIAPTLNKTAKLLIFTMGGEEDIAYKNCQSMLKHFDAADIKYEYSQMPGGHSWLVWRNNLHDFAPRIFK